MNRLIKIPKLRRQICVNINSNFVCPYDLEHKSNNDIKKIWQLKIINYKKKISLSGRLLLNEGFKN